MWTALTLSSLLLGQAYGGLLGDVPLIQRDASTDARMRRYVDSLIDPIDKRQSTTSTVNITQWNANVLSSCASTLQSLNGVASNPSGMAACYNIPFWDNSTGVFHADLRLFMISQPTGSFAGISAQDVQVDLSYASANVQSVDNAALRRRDDTISLLLYRDGLDKRQAPTLSQSYALYGELNQNVIGSDSTTLENAIVPTVTLSGTNAQGQTASTTLSMTEAAFLVGSFSTSQNAVTQANVATAQAPMQTLVVAPGQTFVLPGVHILIAPIGGIVTGMWALLFALTVGYGTVSRMQFKEQYRRRVARATKGRVATI